MNERAERYIDIRQSSIVWWISGAVCVGVVGWLDTVTGYKLGFALFYLIPIFLVTWKTGLLPGIVTSVISAAVWLFADIAAKEFAFDHFIVLWNTSIRLVIFLMITYLLWRIRIDQIKQKELMEFIVHDLRNPLAVTKDALKLFDKKTEGKLDPTETKFIKIGISASGRAITLVNSILDISRMEARKMPVVKEETAVRKTVEGALDEVRVSAEKNNIALRATGEGPERTLFTDKALLYRVLVNLIGNAIKVSRPGTDVEVNVSGHERDWIAISVIDKGPGIPESMVRSVFNKFEQVRIAESGIDVGSGIGLNFCKLAVKVLGGTIWIESKEGKGTKVIFTLPAKK